MDEIRQKIAKLESIVNEKQKDFEITQQMLQELKLELENREKPAKKRLSKEEVEEIKIAIEAGEDNEYLAKKFGVSLEVINYWERKVIGADTELLSGKPSTGKARRVKLPKPETCTEDGCSNAYFCKGLCKTHYNKEWWQKKHPPVPRLIAEDRYCQHEGCKRESTHKGLCINHYQIDWNRRHRDDIIKRRHDPKSPSFSLNPRTKKRHDEERLCPFCFPDSPYAKSEKTKDEYIKMQRRRNLETIAFAKSKAEGTKNDEADEEKPPNPEEVLIKELEKSTDNIPKVNIESRKYMTKQERRKFHKQQKKWNEATGGYIIG